MTPIADMKGLEIIVSGEATLPYQGDPVQIQNAVRNLIDNALKYSPAESAVEIQITAHPRPQITLTDQGPGFPVDEIETLAARFQRGQNAQGTIGSGLGLTIAKDVAHAHGGTLELGNREEGGACVSLLL